LSAPAKPRYSEAELLDYRLARACGAHRNFATSPVSRRSNRDTTLVPAVEVSCTLAERTGMAVIPFNPLAGGLLSGKYAL